jgi:hypothetical protein
MADEQAKKPDLKVVTPLPDDASDLSDLWFDPALGDGLTDTILHDIPVDKPKDFFRVYSDPNYRRQTEVYTHKPEGQIEEQHFILAKPMQGLIEEARPATIVVCIYRDGSLRLWPLKRAKMGEKDNDVWKSARAIARDAMTKWVRLVWARRVYQRREAQAGYAPDPDWTKVLKLDGTKPLKFDDLVTLAFGEHGIIRDKNHPVYRDLIGAAAKKADDDGTDL